MLSILPPPRRLTLCWATGSLLLLILASFPLSGYAVVYNTDTTVSVENSITGTETVEVTNEATVDFTAAQSYTGTTTVTSGQLILEREGGFTNTRFVIESDGILEFANKSPVSNWASIRINGGELKFTGTAARSANDYFANVGPIVLNGGKITATNSHANYGSFLLRDDITVKADSEISANYTVRGNWGNNSQGGVITPSEWNVAKDVTLTVSGRGRFMETDGSPIYVVTINKTGEGTALFTQAALASNSGSKINILGGMIEFRNANAFGGSAESALSIDVTNGKLFFSGGRGDIYNNINIAEGQSFDLTVNGTHLRGSLSGAGNVNKLTASGVLLYEQNFLYLEGNNSRFTGTFSFNGGAIFFNKLNTSFANASLVSNGTTVFLAPEADMVYSLGSFSGNGELRPSTNSQYNFKVSVGSLNKDETFSGAITDHEGKTIGLQKVGTGTWTLSGNNSFSGGLEIKNGTVKFTSVNSLGTGAVQTTKTSTEAGNLLFQGNTGQLSNSISLAEGTFFTVQTNNNGTLTLNGALSGKGTIDVQNGTLVYAGSNAVLTPSVNLASGTVFQFSKASTHNGNFSGTGEVKIDQTVRLNGDNTSFEGTYTVNELTYLHNPKSSSGKADYNIQSRMVMVTNSESDNVYELGSITGKGRIRPSTESSFKEMFLKVGGNNLDTVYDGWIMDYKDQSNHFKVGLIKTGTGMLTITKNLQGDPLEWGNLAYSLGTVVEAGTLKIAQGAAIGTRNGEDLVLVGSPSNNNVPGIILEGRIDGKLQVDGEYILDFSDGSLQDEGIVTGELLFGENASLAIWMAEEAEVDRSMSYTLQANNTEDALAKMTELYLAGAASGAFADIWSLGLSDGNLVFQIDTAKVPEPATWFLLLTSFVGILFLKRKNRKNSLSTL